MYGPTYFTAATPKFRSCNICLVPVISCSLMFFLAGFARGGSATWNLNPTSGDWNTATNWTPVNVPNGSADTATFAFSNTTAISTSANTTVDGITFAPGASSFTITASSGFILTISGVGITNNSGVAQNFVGAISNSNAVRLLFNGSATAGSGTFFTMNGGGGDFAGGFVVFNDNATAGNGSFTNNGTAIPGRQRGSRASAAPRYSTAARRQAMEPLSTTGLRSARQVAAGRTSTAAPLRPLASSSTTVARLAANSAAKLDSAAVRQQAMRRLPIMAGQ